MSKNNPLYRTKISEGTMHNCWQCFVLVRFGMSTFLHVCILHNNCSTQISFSGQLYFLGIPPFPRVEICSNMFSFNSCCKMAAVLPGPTTAFQAGRTGGTVENLFFGRVMWAQEGRPSLVEFYSQFIGQNYVSWPSLSWDGLENQIFSNLTSSSSSQSVVLRPAAAASPGSC